MEQTKAYEKLQECLKDIFAFSISRVYDKQDAEDLTNDIIIAVLSSINRLENDSAFYGYMWKIAENTFKQYIHNKNKLNVMFDEKFCGVYWETPEQKCIDNEEVAILRRELTLLSKQYREATIKYYIENKNCSLISKEMNISEEMVKYYLFKTRKILKEGVNMERKYGEKSYNPSKFGINFWGNGGNSYIWETFERKLPGNIVLAAYEKPLTIEELSLELGVSAVYLEDELEILLKYNFITKSGNKYQTNFLIFKSDFEEEFKEKVPTLEICKSATEEIKAFTEKLLPKYKIKDFEIELDDNALRWFIVNIAMINALGDFEENISQTKFGAYPRLNATTYGFVYGHDNDYRYGYFAGIYGRCDNSQNTAYYSAVNYNVIKSCQWWQGSSKARSDTLCDAILKRNIADCTSQEVVAQLVKEGMVSVKDGILCANFPTLTSRENHYIREELKPITDIIVGCMEKVCSSAALLFKKHTPKELKEHCEQLAYVRYQADAMGIIIEKLVEDKFLIVPEKRTNLCMFGVKRYSENNSKY